MTYRLASMMQNRNVALQGGSLDLFDDSNAQVYGDSEIDPNTMPFNPEDLCDPHSVACCVRRRYLFCGECGEVL